jgi:hypothetical protein
MKHDKDPRQKEDEHEVQHLKQIEDERLRNEWKMKRQSLI